MGLSVHDRRIADSTSLCVILYNNPSMCGGVKIDVDAVARLGQLPNIVGIKDSSGDLQNTNEYLRVVPPGFSVMQGRDTLIYPSLLFGAAGAVPASANVAPNLCVAIFESFHPAHHPATLDPHPPPRP